MGSLSSAAGELAEDSKRKHPQRLTPNTRIQLEVEKLRSVRAELLTVVQRLQLAALQFGEPSQSLVLGVSAEQTGGRYAVAAAAPSASDQAGNDERDDGKRDDPGNNGGSHVAPFSWPKPRSRLAPGEGIRASDICLPLPTALFPRRKRGEAGVVFVELDVTVALDALPVGAQAR